MSWGPPRYQDCQSSAGYSTALTSLTTTGACGRSYQTQLRIWVWRRSLCFRDNLLSLPRSGLPGSGALRVRGKLSHASHTFIPIPLKPSKLLMLEKMCKPITNVYIRCHKTKPSGSSGQAYGHVAALGWSRAWPPLQIGTHSPACHSSHRFLVC